jgi:Tfp pilus assembly protein PilN
MVSVMLAVKQFLLVPVELSEARKIQEKFVLVMAEVVLCATALVAAAVVLTPLVYLEWYFALYVQRSAFVDTSQVVPSQLVAKGAKAMLPSEATMVK